MKNIVNLTKTLHRYAYLLKLLVGKKIKKKYKGSVLGIAWSLLSPLLDMVILTIVFSTLLSRDISNFPVYLLSGKLLFGLFASTTNASVNAIHNASSLIKKIYLPKYLIVLSDILSNFVFFLISLIDLIIIMGITGAGVTWQVLYAPFYILLLLIFTSGISFMLASVSVFFRDIQHIYAVFTTALMYASAIFYPAQIVPDRFQFVLQMNPLYHFIEGFRQVVYHGNSPGLINLVICLALAGLSMVIGVYIFEKNQNRFIFYL
jgi:ABC-type polysaccharide/polyol phosphate export permease